MTWITVADNNKQPEKDEVVEVRLANGAVQLAEWNGQAFTVPGMGVPMKNVASWRSMADSDSHLKTSTLKSSARD